MDKKREKAIRDLMMLKMIVNHDFAEAIEMAVSALMNEDDTRPVEARPWWYRDYPDITTTTQRVSNRITIIS